MTLYTATFADHIITRNTDRAYSHAWIVTNTAEGTVYAKGFAGDLAKAQTAAAASLPRDISDRDKKNARIASGHRSTAKHFGFPNVQDWYASITERTTAHRAALTTEVVAVTS